MNMMSTKLRRRLNTSRVELDGCTSVPLFVIGLLFTPDFYPFCNRHPHLHWVENDSIHVYNIHMYNTCALVVYVYNLYNTCTPHLKIESDI